MDPVSITNQVTIYLQDENGRSSGRKIDPTESVMIFLSFSIAESFELNQNLSNQDRFQIKGQLKIVLEALA